MWDSISDSACLKQVCAVQLSYINSWNMLKDLLYITQMTGTTNFVYMRTFWGKELAVGPSNLWFPPIHCENVGPHHGRSKPIGMSLDTKLWPELWTIINQEWAGSSFCHSSLHIGVVPLFYCIWIIKRAGDGMEILIPCIGHPHHIHSSSRDRLWLQSILSKTVLQTICMVPILHENDRSELTQSRCPLQPPQSSLTLPWNSANHLDVVVVSKGISALSVKLTQLSWAFPAP